jgi:hypothetical protein
MIISAQYFIYYQELKEFLKKMLLEIMHNKKHSADFREAPFAGHVGTLCHN